MTFQIKKPPKNRRLFNAFGMNVLYLDHFFDQFIEDFLV